MRQSKKNAILFGILAGIYLAIAFVNPYEKEVFLSEMILQLSGSRGFLVMGCSLPELVGYMLRMIPNYIVTMVWGINLYRQFCTASVYVFSRCTNRWKWYRQTVVWLYAKVCVYEMSLVGTVILLTSLRFKINFQMEGFRILTCHLAIYTLWNLIWILLMNLLAIRLGSSTAASIVMGVQAVCTAGLGVVSFLEQKRISDLFVGKLLQFNPVVYTILGWQCENKWDFLNLKTSILLLSLCCIVIISAGGFWIHRLDLITENMEMETI